MGGGIYRCQFEGCRQIKVAPHKEICSDYKTAEAIIYVLCGCSGLKFQAFLKANFQATERKKLELHHWVYFKINVWSVRDAGTQKGMKNF